MERKQRAVDTAIIGGGMAGLTSAVYSSRAGLDTIVFEREILGGQIAQTSTIENFPALYGISGAELSQKLVEQAKISGATLEEFDLIEKVDLQSKVISTVECDFLAKAIIIATGSSPKKLPVENEPTYRGKGIHYCAFCDGSFYKGKTVAVVGGGNSALEGARYLATLAKKVIVLVRKGSFRGEKLLAHRLEKLSNIEVMFGVEISQVKGDKLVNCVVLTDGRELAVDGIFVFIGENPNTADFPQIKLSSSGHIVTNEKMQTEIEGVFAVGDVREKEIRQLTTAASDGTIAAIYAEKYIRSL